jgi:hypothetical protein
MIKGRSQTRKAKTTRIFVSAGSRLNSFDLVFLFWMLALVSQAAAQRPDITEPEKPEVVVGNESPTTMFPHATEGRFWLSGQANFVYQTNPEFYAAYSGEHSFRSNYDKATGRIMTLYGGFQFSRLGEVLVSAEEAGGLGLSSALGIAAFPNLDAVRDATLSEAPYLARVMYHQVFALSAK